MSTEAALGSASEAWRQAPLADSEPAWKSAPLAETPPSESAPPLTPERSADVQKFLKETPYPENDRSLYDIASTTPEAIKIPDPSNETAANLAELTDVSGVHHLLKAAMTDEHYKSVEGAAMSGGVHLVNSMLNPLGLATLGVSGISKLGGKAAAIGFGLYQLAHNPEQLKAIWNASSFDERAHRVADLLIGDTAAAFGLKHGFTRTKPIISEPPTTGGELTNAIENTQATQPDGTLLNRSGPQESTGQVPSSQSSEGVSSSGQGPEVRTEIGKVTQLLNQRQKSTDPVERQRLWDEAKALEATPDMKKSTGESGSAMPQILAMPAKAFWEQDIKPFTVEGAGNTVTALRQIKSFVAPALMSEEAARTSGLVRHHTAELARKQEIARESMKQAASDFDKNSPGENLLFIDRMEKGQTQPTPELTEFSKTMRDALDQRLEQVRALGTGRLQQAIENYFPHIWEDPAAATSFYGRIFGKRPLEGPKSFLKPRSIPTTAEGVAAGLKPVSENPIELTLLKLHEIDRYIMGQKIMAEMKDKGLAEFVSATERPPEGYTKIDDRVAQVIQMKETIKSDGSPGAPEMVIRGHYYAPEDAARIVNNYLSPGLRGVKVYDGVRWLGNTLNQAQLGLSAFHLGMVSIDAGVSKVALGIEHLLSGSPLKGLSEAAQAPGAPIINMVRGNKMLHEYYRPGSQGAEIGHYMDAAIKGGGRATMDSFYQTNAWKNFTKAVKSGNIPGAVLRAPFAVLHLVAKPVLEYAVPRMKLGMFADMARTELERLGPSASLDEQRAVMAKAWDSVDNRMGQMVYDNLFWNKAFKDSLMAGTRSVGWNLGTIREIGGGLVDTAAAPARIARAVRGKSKLGERVITHKMAYAMALPMTVGLLGSIYQYLHTGKAPGQKDDGSFGDTGDVLKDLFLPRTGKINAQEEPERVLMPSYMKDVFAYAKHPVITVENKASPWISLVAQMLNNKDYYGTQIVDPGDQLWQKVKDESLFVAKQFTPFSVQSSKHRVGQKAADKIESAVGVTPAPAELTRTPAHQAMMEAMMRRMPSSAKTKEEQARYELRKQIIKAVKEGTPIAESIAKGRLPFNLIQRRNIAKAGRTDPRALMFSHLTMDEAKNVLELSNLEERTLFEPLMKLKQVRMARIK